MLLGFLSYGFGIALMFWAITARLWLDRVGHVRSFLGGVAIGVTLLFCHLSAFATYAVMLVGIGLDQLLRQRRNYRLIMLMGLELVPGALLYLSMSTASQGRMHYDWPYWHTKIFGAAKSFSSGTITADIAFVVGALSVTLLVVLNRPRISWPLLPGLLVLSMLYFLVPQHVSGGSYVDVRIPAVVLMLLLVAVELRPRQTTLVVPLALLAAGAFIIKQGALVASWAESDLVLSQIVRKLDMLPDGAILLQASCLPEASDILGVYTNRQPPLDHVTAYAAHEGKRFAAVSWTIKGQQTISTAPSYLPFKQIQAAMGPSICSMDGYRAVLRDAQETLAAQSASGGIAPPLYLVLSRPPQARMLEQEARLVAELAMVEIYQVRQ